MKYLNQYISHRMLWLVLSVMAVLTSYAFNPLFYANKSVLSEGKWVKISVPSNGVYKVTKSQLSQWGFNDLSKVRIYGYGGNRINSKLAQKNYIDDLPMIQSVAVADGIVFYGLGPETWTKSGDVYHKDNNVYTNDGYYFITETDTPERQIRYQGSPNVSSPETMFVDRLHYELDLTSPGESGYILVGESFKTQNDRKFTFAMPGYKTGEEAIFDCALVTKTFTASQVEFSVNGQPLDILSSDRINAISNSAYLHGDYMSTQHKFNISNAKAEIKVTVRNVSATQNVWLDYIALNYPRELALPSTGHLNFWSSKANLELKAGDATSVTVWDVTDPQEITALNTSADTGTMQWATDYPGERSYVAWSASAQLPAPKFEKNLTNQNIHALPNTEMIIFTLPELRSQAERIAKMHGKTSRPLHVTVLNVDEVYNEFASGAGDVSALRKCMKMFYDRSAEDSVKLQYVLLMGRATYDNRHLTSQFAGAGAYNTIPYYIGGSVKSQLSDNTAFGTDDFIAMLDDDTGNNMGIDNLSVAVGRMPVTSPSEAKNAVDKLLQYVEESATGTWKNSFLFLADDGDNGIHAKQTEDMIAALIETPYQQNFVTKVYVDAYDIIGGQCVGGRTEMFRMLDEGIVWWNYSGHANNHSWTAESMLTYTDIGNMYLKKIPILMAATCDFLRWDSNTISGGEIMYNERNGGIISAISATRPVYISDNGLFTKAVGRAISKRNDDGQLPRLGDIYRNAKNNILTDKGEHRSNPNRLRYVLMGDPALILPTPSNIIRVDSIGDQPLDPEAQITLMALQQTEIKGSITTPSGELIEDFNGTVQINIYDAEQSITTKGDRAENINLTFEQHGKKLYTGLTQVKNGRFSMKIAMPSEIADNFRPALMNMYAHTPDKKTEAVGINKDFYVYGYDETVEADTVAPTINSMVLNHSSFNDGDTVNPSPMMIAEVSDDIGINLSAAGIGHQMVLTLDGGTTYTDVSLYYTPSPDGSPSGTINYPLGDIMIGEHTLQLKVWDTASNSATREINFTVNEKQKPTIFKVYTDVNPASTEVKFFIDHNRPNAELSVTITVYDLLGHPLWETNAKGVSDMFTSAPVIWDLCDTSGRRLPRGIYLYRATISTDDGENYASEARRLAVTAY